MALRATSVLPRAALPTLIAVSVACAPPVGTASDDQIGRFDLGSRSLVQWKLPNKLREISGLALTDDERLVAVSDESAIVYELDHRKGAIVKSFMLGDPVLRGDFEGIAVQDGVFYLVTSDGKLYATTEGNDGEHVQYRVYDTGLGRRCEIEGLADDERSATLLLACKGGRPGDGPLFVAAWSPATSGLLGEREIVLPEREIAARLRTKSISPSGIAVDPETGHLYLIAARQRAIVQLGRGGELLDAIILPAAGRHRQAEGLEISRDGKILIADEGGRKKARLGIYAPRPEKATDPE